MHLDVAKTMAYKVQISNSDDAFDFRHPLGVTLGGIVFALHDITTALRSIYVLLEKIDRKLDRR